jgi:NhaC family Na+:H+ antiporter
VSRSPPSPDPAEDPTAQPRPISIGWALVPVVTLVALLSTVLLWLPRMDPSFEGSGHLPLVIAAAVGGIIAWRHGWEFDSIESGIVDAIRMSMRAILILVVIGMLMGTWLAGGIVPALIDWGLMLLSPRVFLPTACAVCSVVSLVSGSSWSTAGTVGLAMIGIGNAMGIDPAMTAGAVVSGAYFGDKLSPMSDTTNLAPAMAGTDLFTHIRHQVRTTGPAWVIAMIGYGVLSAGISTTADAGSVAHIQTTIESSFHPGLVHLLAPLLVIGLVLRRVPALPTLLLGVLLGAVVAVAVEGASVGSVLVAAMSGYTADTGDPTVDELLSRGGMSSMASTVFLVLCAMSFGGVMERTGMLRTLAERLLRLAKSTGSLIATTVLTSIGINVVAGDQYIAIVVPGRMYADAYAEQGLHPKNLSRAIEDGGTITSPLIPWNTCGAFMAGTLMVPTGAYFIYAFLNLVNPLISILYGFTGWSIAPADPPDGARDPGPAPDPSAPAA